jgi:hypothetical protein
VVENLIVKAATSPFSLLGSMFGGGDELSFVAFDPGHADIPVAETNKLNTLAKALYERPTLSMEINGSVNPAMDREEMARAKLQRQIKAIFIKEMADAGKPVVAADDLKLEPADYERLVPRAYSNTFGAYRPAGTNQMPAPSAPPPSKKPAPAPMHVVKNWKSPFKHGAEQMRWLQHQNDIVVVPQPAPVAPGVATGKPAAPAPIVVAQSDLAAMEEQLLQKIEITSDDYRQLMQDRASQVEGYLLKSGKVTADRLFITVPKPVGPNSKGEDRVNLTLD